jgi:hypothetical protein
MGLYSREGGDVRIGFTALRHCGSCSSSLELWAIFIQVDRQVDRSMTVSPYNVAP